VKSLRILGAASALSLVLGLANEAHARGAPAGTVINNTAEVSYVVGSVNATTSSNLVSVTVAEIINVDVTAQTPILDVNAGDTQRAVRYLVTNTGNSTETFLLTMSSTITGDQFDPVPYSTSIYLDDGNNSFTAADTPYVPGAGGNDPVLNADQEVVVWVVNDIPSGVADGNLGRTRLAATSRTGTGAAGTVFAGQGTNPLNGTAIDAIIGSNEGDDEADSDYRITGVNITAVKSQTVVGPAGSTPVPGARIDYSIVINMTGTGTAAGAVFSDNIPANTIYVANSLRLNSLPLTDGADADAGDYSSTTPERVRVTLGDLTSTSGPQTVTFSVTIRATN
jgi:uncharacterized repeat protein (TIGR01451 family)